MVNNSNKGVFYIFLSALLWSTGGLGMKFVPFNGIVVNCFRAAFAFLFFAVMRKGFRIKINRTIVLGALCFFATTTMCACANKLTTAANAIVLQYTAPMFVLIMQCVQDRTKPKPREVIILGTAFFGTVLFFCDQLDPGRLAGNILGVLSGVFFAAVFIVNRMPGASSEDSNMLGFVIAALFGLPFVLTSDLHFTPVIAAAALFLGVVQIGAAYYVFSKGINLIPPVNASLISLLEAILNPVWVFLAMGERPGTFALMGAALIIGAIAANIVLEHKETERMIREEEQDGNDAEKRCEISAEN